MAFLLIWLLMAVFVVGIVLAYVALRQDRPEQAAKVEREVKRAAVALAGATKTSTRATATAVARKVEESKQARIPLRWVGAEESIKIHGFEIRSPMTYVANRRAGRQDEPSSIDPREPVRAPRTSPSPLPYWPRYEQMTPEQRHVYLQWLAQGRRHLPSAIGYAFVFFYGLERRALIDQQDLGPIIDEVLRLRALHNAADREAFSGSFERYTADFLWLLAAGAGDAFTEQHIQALMSGVRYWHDDQLAVGLGWFARQNRPLPGWGAFIVASELPQSRRSVVTARAGDEFKELFLKRYSEKFDEGLTLQPAARAREFVYQPASAAIGSATCETSNPLGRMSQFKPLSRLWNECIEDLRALSKTRQRQQEDEELTPEAWEALPPELQADSDHPLTKALCDLVEQHSRDEGHAVIEISELAETLEFERRDRYTPTQSRKLCERAELIGYGVEPDARLTGKGYRNDDRVAVFLIITEYRAQPERYNPASCILQLGLGIAAADGQIQRGQLDLITQDVERWFELNAHEQRRLEALESLLMVQEPQLTRLKALVKGLTPLQREAVGRLLLALAAHSGTVTKEELKAVRRCYNALELDPDEIDRALASMRKPKHDEEPVTVRKGQPQEVGETIPPQETEDTFTLDEKAIAAIQAETEKVAAMLSNAMQADEEDEEDETPSDATDPPVGPSHGLSPADVASASLVTTQVTTPPQADVQNAPGDAAGEDDIAVAGPPSRYAAFYQDLLKQDQWTRSEAAALARQHDQMLAGALEALNEWSLERFGDILFDQDGDMIYVERNLLEGHNG